MVKINPWNILGIVPGASEKELKERYKCLALEYHPDTYKQYHSEMPESEAQDRFKLLGLAYELLRKNLVNGCVPDLSRFQRQVPRMAMYSHEFSFSHGPSTFASTSTSSGGFGGVYFVFQIKR